VTRSDSHDVESALAPVEAGAAGDLFDWLPRLVLNQVRLEGRLAHWARDGKLPPALHWLEKGTGTSITLDRPEVLWRSSGLHRPSLVAQLTVPRLATRLGLGIELPLAHTIVDRLLGFDRSFAESRLQLTPVEWGVWTFLILRGLESFDARSSHQGQDRAHGPWRLGAGDLTLDRVGPDPFDATDLGSIVTIRWSVHVGTIAAAVRLWVAESLVQLWLASSASPAAHHGGSIAAEGSREFSAGPQLLGQRGELSSIWRATAGVVAVPHGLGRLRAGVVLPLTESRLTGSPVNPGGPIDLLIDLEGQDVRYRIPSRPVADSGGRLVRLLSGPLQEPRPRDPINASPIERSPMSQSNAPGNPAAPAQAVAALDVPVTLTVELGRINLTLTQLADLKAGDVVELSRHSRAPVELTSNGRLVARGELILIDTALGVRVTNVFL
jgi:flagellar motor switch protein FliN/FliY